MKSAVVLESLKVALAIFLGASYASQTKSPDVEELTKEFQEVELSKTPNADPVPTPDLSGRIEQLLSRAINGAFLNPAQLRMEELCTPYRRLGGTEYECGCEALATLTLLDNSGLELLAITQSSVDHAAIHCSPDIYKWLHGETGHLPSSSVLANLFEERSSRSEALMIALERGVPLELETFDKALKEAVKTGDYKILKAAALIRQRPKRSSDVCLDCSIYCKLCMNGIEMRLTKDEIDHLFLNCKPEEYRHAQLVSPYSLPTEGALMEMIRRDPTNLSIDYAFNHHHASISPNFLREYLKAIGNLSRYEIFTHTRPDSRFLKKMGCYVDDPVEVANILTENGREDWFNEYNHWHGVCPTQESLDIAFKHDQFCTAAGVVVRCNMRVSQSLIDEAFLDPESTLRSRTFSYMDSFCPSRKIFEMVSPQLEDILLKKYFKHCSGE